jgi:tetratricopeptide (TPR) repeat protein
MIIRCSLLLLSLLFSLVGSAQYFAKEKLLIDKVKTATDDSARLMAMSTLAEFYYLYRATSKGDSLLNEQLSLAEVSTNKNLLLLALFDKGIVNVPNWTSSKNFDHALQYLNKGVDYAGEIGRDDYQAIAYMRKATIYRKRGEYDNAMNEIILALAALSKNEKDSLRAAIAIETGEIAFAKGKAVEAYKHYNQAYDIAYSIKNIRLQSEVYHRYAELYYSLSDTKLGKDNLLKSLDLNRKYNNDAGILQDYFDLARNTDAKEYVDKVIELSRKSGDEKNNIRSKRLMFSYLMVKGKNCKATLDYYYKNEGLQQSYVNSGLPAYYWNLGNVYKYCGRFDSAIYYFKKGEAELSSTYDPLVVQSAFKSMAECYEQSGDITSATAYYLKAFELNRKSNNLAAISLLSLKLSDLYNQKGNFKSAYEFQKQHLSAKDSLQVVNEKSLVVLLEVDRENKRHLKDLEDARIKESRIRNLQYMGITAAIATFFIFMMLMGMFPISKVTIKMLSFFAFICLFEFIVLLIDSYLHKITHGEPLKIWLIKIFLIALLVPLQHFLEHGMVHFLASQRLLRMRQHLSLKRLFVAIKKPAPKDEVGIEEDTAVL